MAKKKLMLNEGDVKTSVKKLLSDRNWFWWMPAANGYGASGVSDFCAFRGGVFLAIETKFGSNKPTKMQKAFLTSIAAESGFAFVVNETRLQYLESWLDAFDRAAQAYAKGERESAEDGALMIDCIREMQLEIV